MPTPKSLPADTISYFFSVRIFGANKAVGFRRSQVAAKKFFLGNISSRSGVIMTCRRNWTLGWKKGLPYLIQDDLTCAQQYFEVHCSRNRLNPEKRLHARRTTRRAVLLSEVFCVRDGRHRKSSSGHSEGGDGGQRQAGIGWRQCHPSERLRLTKANGVEWRATPWFYSFGTVTTDH